MQLHGGRASFFLENCRNDFLLFHVHDAVGVQPEFGDHGQAHEGKGHNIKMGARD